MILILIWDGLRPDMIDAELTPHLFEMAGRGVFCHASHAVFPTATRINSASLATGCYPGKHGIVDNELYVPALNPTGPISCADWRALQAMAESEGGRLLTTPTLAETLHAAGRRLVAGGSGSPGTTYLANPTVTDPVVNWACAWPPAVEDEIALRQGGMLTEDSDSTERNRFVFAALRDHLIPEQRPDVVTLWITEPDHAQHYHGLKSPEVRTMLHEVDEDVHALVTHLQETCGPDGLTCFVISDHGFETVQSGADPDAEMVEAGLISAPGSGEVVRTFTSLYLNGDTRDRLAEVVAFMQSRDWVSAVFVRDDLLGQCPDAMPQSAVMGGHARSAEIMFSYRWTDEANEHGVPGSTVCPGRVAATHGSSAPYTINNTLVAWGAGIKAGVSSAVPCGIVDIAPTVLHLLGVPQAESMQGRVLHELLADGPDPAELSVTTSTRETVAGPRRQVAHYSHVEGYRYLDRVNLLP
jgi:arylsulfatase A-like enzyme